MAIHPAPIVFSQGLALDSLDSSEKKEAGETEIFTLTAEVLQRQTEIPDHISCVTLDTKGFLKNANTEEATKRFEELNRILVERNSKQGDKNKQRKKITKLIIDDKGQHCLSYRWDSWFLRILLNTGITELQFINVRVQDYFNVELSHLSSEDFLRFIGALHTAGIRKLDLGNITPSFYLPSTLQIQMDDLRSACWATCDCSIDAWLMWTCGIFCAIGILCEGRNPNNQIARALIMSPERSRACQKLNAEFMANFAELSARFEELTLDWHNLLPALVYLKSQISPFYANDYTSELVKYGRDDRYLLKSFAQIWGHGQHRKLVISHLNFCFVRDTADDVLECMLQNKSLKELHFKDCLILYRASINQENYGKIGYLIAQSSLEVVSGLLTFKSSDYLPQDLLDRFNGYYDFQQVSRVLRQLQHLVKNLEPSKTLMRFDDIRNLKLTDMVAKNLPSEERKKLVEDSGLRAALASIQAALEDICKRNSDLAHYYSAVKNYCIMPEAIFDPNVMLIINDYFNDFAVLTPKTTIPFGKLYTPAFQSQPSATIAAPPANQTATDDIDPEEEARNIQAWNESLPRVRKAL